MNKAYVIWPLAGLLVFGAFYANFTRKDAEKIRLAEVAKKEEQKKKITDELERRRKALEDAIVAQKQRQADREAKLKLDEEEKAAFQALVDRRDRAFDDINKHLRPYLEQKKGDVDDLTNQIAKLDLQKKQYSDEEAFLRTYVGKVQASKKTYEDLLDQLAKAEKARAEAVAKAAAEAAKKKS